MIRSSSADYEERAGKVRKVVETTGRAAAAFESPYDAQMVNRRVTGSNPHRAPIRTTLRTLDDGRVVLIAVRKDVEQALLRKALEEWAP